MQLYSLQAGQPITRQRRGNRVAPLLAVAATIFYAAPATVDKCSNLINLSLLPNTKITLAQTYTAGCVGYSVAFQAPKTYANPSPYGANSLGIGAGNFYV